LEPAEGPAAEYVLAPLRLVPQGLDGQEVPVDGHLEVLLEDPRHLRLDVQVILVLPQRKRHVAAGPALPTEDLGLVPEHLIEQRVESAKRAAGKRRKRQAITENRNHLKLLRCESGPVK